MVTKSFALVTCIKPGCKVITDGGFTCMPKGKILTVQGPSNSTDPDEIWIECAEGEHYLNGQLSDDDLSYVGLYPVEELAK